MRVPGGRRTQPGPLNHRDLPATPRRRPQAAVVNEDGPQENGLKENGLKENDLNDNGLNDNGLNDNGLNDNGEPELARKARVSEETEPCPTTRP